ncbi:hypothetical protein CEXT_413001 [Caerostris extrusa]|uniref:Uncharacterized protein n=1 Tax=Caerostris extrusa TaxID=172846 RepID=A0AAV4N706_CAEEX|nr:hypothetical protein CEXT_413001 [Caerostris extrusa]
MTTKQDNRFQPKKQRKKKAIKMHLQENKLVSDHFLGVATGESSQSMWFYENTQVYLTRISKFCYPSSLIPPNGRRRKCVGAGNVNRKRVGVRFKGPFVNDRLAQRIKYNPS